MFKIVSLASGYQIDAEDKDALFSELENANARAKDKKETVKFRVYQIGDQDSILDEREISLPFTGIIEEVLDGFGRKNPKSSKFSFLNLFKPRTSDTTTKSNIPVETQTVSNPHENEELDISSDSVAVADDGDSEEEFQPVYSDTEEVNDPEDSQLSSEEPLLNTTE